MLRALAISTSAMLATSFTAAAAGPIGDGVARKDGTRAAVRVAGPLAGGPAIRGDGGITVALDGTADAVRLDLKPHSVRSRDFTIWVDGDQGIQPGPPAPPVRTYRGVVEGVPGSFVWGAMTEAGFSGAFTLGEGETWFSVEPDPEASARDGRTRYVVLARDEIQTPPATCATFDQPLGPDDPRAGIEIDIEGGPADGARAGGDVDRDRSHVRMDASLAGDLELGLPGSSPKRARGRTAIAAPVKGGGVAEAGSSGILVTEIAIDADFQYYLANGSSVAEVVADIEAVFNGASAVYERDVEISWEITGIVVRTSSGANPYTTNSAVGLLCQLRDAWNSTNLSSVRRDTVQLFTGRDLSGTTVGIAFNNAICNVIAGSPCGGGSQNIGYSLVQSQWINNADRRAALTSHELGHAYGASHCSGNFCHIMCSTIGQCAGVDAGDLVFGIAARAQIMNFRDTRTCLHPLAATLQSPVIETWETTAVDPAIWSWVSEAAIVEPPFPAPSPPFAMELRSFGNVPLRQGDIRTAAVDLLEIDPQVSMQIGWTGLEAGERVLVEYRNVLGVWEELGTLTSDGSDAPFADVLFDVPNDGRHRGFRLRVRLIDGNDFDDRVYVDDIVIDGPAAPPCRDLDEDGDVDLDDLAIILPLWGPCSGACLADFDGDGMVGFQDLLAVLGSFGPCI